jgi:hypothetical protein
MDDLDRIFRRLVHNVRTTYPAYLTRPFEVAELYQTLVPYRHNRRELAIETNQDYEVAVCRLLSGERGYVVSEDRMQQAIRRELESSNPNTALFRQFAASRVALAPDAPTIADVFEAVTPTAELTTETAGQAPAAAVAPTNAPATVHAAAPLTGAPASTAPTGAASSHAASVDRDPPASDATTGPFSIPRASAARANAPAAPAPSTPQVQLADRAPRAAVSSAASTSSPSSGRSSSGSCRYCGGALPVDRRAQYCPHCGQNLTVQRCPACSTELDVQWKFCITCGRGVAAT